MMALMHNIPLKQTQEQENEIDIKRIDPAVCVSVSVVIVTYNSKQYVDTCLTSLLQTLPQRSEIVILDNASTDGTAEYIAAQYPMVKLIAYEDNLGFAAGNNLAVQYSSGEYVVFLNPDTSVEADWLEPMLKLFESDPTVGMVTPKILLMNDPTRVNTCGNNVHLTGLALCRGVNKSCDSSFVAHVTEVNAVSGAAFMMRRDLYLTLDGFDEMMFMYMEDTDLSMRARLAGYKTYYVPESIVYHDYRLRFGRRKTFYQERNRYVMLLKLLRWRTLLLMLPAFLFAEAITWGFTLLKDRSNIVNKPGAYLSIFRMWRGIMANRKRIQALREISDAELIADLDFRLEFEQTGDDFVTKVAHLVFDPVFWLMHRFLLVVVRW